ncbi:AEC family transporter [Craurococcus roseus]|uniref:AEC family transporter n=1 Tax=Craurococcus roseus TaxID=77585 RepID=A0ABP3QIZ7_9PROT
MQAVLNAVLPLFGLILTGYLCGRFGVFSRAATDILNRFAVYLALPALMFLAMAKIEPGQAGQTGFSLAFGGGIAATFALGFALSRWRGRRVAQAGIEGLDASYGNVGFMGIPLCLLVFGPDSLPAAVVASLFTACALFLFAVALIEADLRGGSGFGRAAGRISFSLLRNPLFLAPLAGLAVALAGPPLPAPVDRFADLLAGAASPCALVCIGLFLAQEGVVASDAPTIGVLIGLKLLFQPAVTALLAVHVFAVPPAWSYPAVLLSALPIGSGPFTIAKLYGLKTGVTSGAILASHLISIVTVSFLVAWLG